MSTALVNNFVLTKFLGLCPVMGATKQLAGAVGMSIATALVLTLTAAISYLLDAYVLQPFHLQYLQIITYIFVIAAMVQLIELIMRNTSPVLHRLLGIYLPLITTNCAVLGLALLISREHHDLFSAIIYGFGTALGFGLVLVLFASIRERLETADVPASFAGAPIAFITAGIMALAFMGFSGMIRAVS